MSFSVSIQRCVVAKESVLAESKSSEQLEALLPLLPFISLSRISSYHPAQTTEMLPLVASTSQSSYTQQPTPSYILRGHTAQISVLHFSSNGRWLYSGDVDGFVAVWDLATFRPRLFWRAHEGGLLTIEEFDGGLLTHARDNLIRFHHLPSSPRSLDRSAASAVPSPKDPTPLPVEWEMHVNAMAYCKMSLFRLEARDAQGREQGLLAVPALTRDELVDVFHIPSLTRVHRSIGAACFIGEGNKTGTVMALSLLSPLSSSTTSPLHLLAGYEDGRSAHFSYSGTSAHAYEPPTGPRDEGEGWELVWEEKGHREAVMDLAIDSKKQHAWTCAADHHLCQYSLFEPFLAPTAPNGATQDDPLTPPPTHLKQHPTPYPGRSSVALRADDKLLAVAGWDGEARLYSPISGKPLAVLSYHRSSLHALAFAPLPPSSPPLAALDAQDSNSDSEEEAETPVEQGWWKRARPWLAVGGKDERISLWEVYPPTRGAMVER